MAIRIKHNLILKGSEKNLEKLWNDLKQIHQDLINHFKPDLKLIWEISTNRAEPEQIEKFINTYFSGFVDGPILVEDDGKQVLNYELKEKIDNLVNIFFQRAFIQELLSKDRLSEAEQKEVIKIISTIKHISLEQAQIYFEDNWDNLTIPSINSNLENDDEIQKFFGSIAEGFCCFNPFKSVIENYSDFPSDLNIKLNEMTFSGEMSWKEFPKFLPILLKHYGLEQIIHQMWSFDCKNIFQQVIDENGRTVINEKPISVELYEKLMNEDDATKALDDYAQQQFEKWKLFPSPNSKAQITK